MTPKILQRKVFLIVKESSNWNEDLVMPKIASAKNGKTPSVSAGEVAIALDLQIPQAVFRKPAYAAKIAIPENAVGSPVINAEVLLQIENLVAEATGLKLTIESLPTPDEF